MIMSELGARLDVSARNITKLVDALEHEGLVRRVAHCTDRRTTVIETTPEGCKVGEQVWGEHCRTMSTLFDELSEVDRADLLRTMSRLHAVLERRMAAAGLNPSRCAEGPRKKRLPGRQSKGESGRWNGYSSGAQLAARSGRQSVRRSGKPGAAGGPPVLLL